MREVPAAWAAEWAGGTSIVGTGVARAPGARVLGWPGTSSTVACPTVNIL